MLDLLKSSTKSSFCLNITFILILIALCPQQSIQQDIIRKSSAMEAACTYNYSSSNMYTCDLYITVSVNSMDVLDITGTHLDNHTDADVQAVYYSIDAAGYFEGEVLTKFENLKTLYVSGRGLVEIKPNAFDVCPKLERLSIFDGQLSFFPSAMLKNCGNLVVFEMMGQKVETFPDDFFGNSRNLEEFIVPVNRLTFLPEKLLQNMEKLKTLRIGFNYLKELSPNFLINASNLEQVSAYDNDFQYQDDIAYALNGKTNLKYLWLDSNNFTNFDFRFFSQFQKLQELSIGERNGNKLTEIQWQSLPASLTDLRIYGVGEEIPEDAFDRVGNLTTLTMYGKAIESFHKNTFKSLTSLVFLYLYDTGLKSLHPELFINQGRLSNLLINNCEIEDLPPGIFTSLVNIGNRNAYNGIKITSTKLRRLNADSFGEHPHLQHIDFSFNEINEIERGIFSRFHSNLTFAGFYKNNCVSDTFAGENLNENEKFEQCYKNWDEIDPNNRPTTSVPTTTPGGSSSNFMNLNIFVVIVLGIFKILFDQL